MQQRRPNKAPLLFRMSLVWCVSDIWVCIAVTRKPLKYHYNMRLRVCQLGLCVSVACIAVRVCAVSYL